MQNTRLTLLFNSLANQIRRELRNPWRRIALFIMSLLFGIFMGTAVAAISGQLGYLDITVAGFVVLLTEIISWAFYSGRWNFNRALLGESLNAFKIGLVYGLVVIAFILGS